MIEPKPVTINGQEYWIHNRTINDLIQAKKSKSNFIKNNNLDPKEIVQIIYAGSSIYEETWDMYLDEPCEVIASVYKDKDKREQAFKSIEEYTVAVGNEHVTFYETVSEYQKLIIEDLNDLNTERLIKLIDEALKKKDFLRVVNSDTFRYKTAKKYITVLEEVVLKLHLENLQIGTLQRLTSSPTPTGAKKENSTKQ